MEKAKIIEHFVKERMAHSTIYANIRRFENWNSFKEGMSNGRPSKFTARTCTNLKKVVNTSVSQRRLGKKYEVLYSKMCRRLAKMNIRCYKREKAPKCTNKQAERDQELWRKLADLLYRSDNS